METGDSRNSEMVGNNGSVCVDIDAEDDGEMIGGLVEMEIVAVMGLIWVPTSTWET